MAGGPTDHTDIAAGLALMGVGAGFGWQASGLELGTSLRMGPGYFPMLLAGLLFFLGAVVLVKAFGRAGEAGGPVAWRGMLFILPAPVFFGLTVRGLGFVPALFVTTLIAAQASPRLRPHHALILAVVVTLFSTLVFSYGLGLPFRRFGPWLPV